MDSGSVSISFLFLISNTFRWLLEWTSPEKVGLQAGLYSGKSRPDLYRTPQALQSVLAPSGPVLHCGVFCTWQWLHRRWNWEPPDALPVWTAGFFFCFFMGGSAKANNSMVWTVLVKIRQGVEENPGEDAEEDGGEDWVSGEPSLQTRFTALVLLLLAFDGTPEGKNGGLGLHSGSDWFVTRLSIFCSPAVHKRDDSDKSSCTKWESHSSSAISSSCENPIKNIYYFLNLVEIN